MRLVRDVADREADLAEAAFGGGLGLAAEARHSDLLGSGRDERRDRGALVDVGASLRLAADDASLLDVLGRDVFRIVDREAERLRLRPQGRQGDVIALRDRDQRDARAWLWRFAGTAKELDTQESDEAQQEDPEDRQRPGPPWRSLVSVLFLRGRRDRRPIGGIRDAGRDVYRRLAGRRCRGSHSSGAGGDRGAGRYGIWVAPPHAKRLGERAGIREPVGRLAREGA